MKRNIWIGLFIGSVTTFGILMIVGVISAQTSIRIDHAEATHRVDSPSADPLSSGFTYQGYLKLNGSPVSATCQMTFTLFDDPVVDNVVGFPVNNQSVAVNNGYFTQLLDMGGLAFTGSAAWIEITVDCNNNLATLPRQLITAVPYAMSLMPGATISSSLDGFMLEVDNNHDGAGTGRAAHFESDGDISSVAIDNTSSGEGLYGDSSNGNGLHGKALSFNHAGIVADNS